MNQKKVSSIVFVVVVGVAIVIVGLLLTRRLSNPIDSPTDVAQGIAVAHDFEFNYDQNIFEKENALHLISGLSRDHKKKKNEKH